MDALWYLTKDGDRSCLRLYRRHYSCRNMRPKQGQFVGPGEHIVLRTDAGDAVFVWRNHGFRKHEQEGIECSLFRNEGPVLSSDLIRQADAVADCAWPGARHYTFVDPRHVRSRNPGYCFIAAGWRRCGVTEGGLLIFERFVVPPVPQQIVDGTLPLETQALTNRLTANIRTNSSGCGVPSADGTPHFDSDTGGGLRPHR